MLKKELNLGLSRIYLFLMLIILTNADNSEFSSGVIIQDISDHFFTFSKIKMSKKHFKSKPKHTRSFSDTNIQNFQMKLSNLSWTDILEHNDPELGFNFFFKLSLTFLIYIFLLKGVTGKVR